MRLTLKDIASVASMKKQHQHCEGKSERLNWKVSIETLN